MENEMVKSAADELFMVSENAEKIRAVADELYKVMRKENLAYCEAVEALRLCEVTLRIKAKV